MSVFIDSEVGNFFVTTIGYPTKTMAVLSTLAFQQCYTSHFFGRILLLYYIHLFKC